MMLIRVLPIALLVSACGRVLADGVTLVYVAPGEGLHVVKLP